MPNLKEIDPWEGCLWLAQSYFCKTMQTRRRKMWRKWGNFRNTISWITGPDLVCRVAYMEGIRYMNLVEIGPVVIEIWGVENGKLAVPVNNTLMCHMAFLAADTRPMCLDEQSDLDMTKSQNGLENRLANGMAHFHWKGLLYHCRLVLQIKEW